MKTEVTTIEQASIPALAMKEEELLPALQSSVWPGAKLDSVKMAIAWCRANRKDPFKRPVHIVPMRVKKPGSKEYEWRDVIMPGINDYRTDAMRTGAFAGLSRAEFGPDKTLELDGVTITFPEWCEVIAYRIVAGHKCEFPSGRVRWLETYATGGYDTTAPNAMWKKRPYGQLEKCAEAMALRRGFPEVGAQNTAEEMEGRVIDAGDVIDITPPKPEVKMPQAKAAPAAPPAAPEPDEPIEGTATEKASEPVQAPAADEPLASEGSKAFIKRKLGERDPAEFAKSHGIDWSRLTTTGFAKLKEALKEAA